MLNPVGYGLRFDESPGFVPFWTISQDFALQQTDAIARLILMCELD